MHRLVQFFEPRLVRIEVDCASSSDIVLSSSRNCFCCPSPSPNPIHHSASLYSHSSSTSCPTSTCSATLVPYATSIITANHPCIVRAFTAEKVSICTECIVLLKKCLRLETSNCADIASLYKQAWSSLRNMHIWFASKNLRFAVHRSAVFEHILAVTDIDREDMDLWRHQRLDTWTGYRTNSIEIQEDCIDFGFSPLSLPTTATSSRSNEAHAEVSSSEGCTSCQLNKDQLGRLLAKAKQKEAEKNAETIGGNSCTAAGGKREE